jgi:transposase, IS5 family
MDAVIPWARLAALVEPAQPIEQAKTRIRSKGEHFLRVIKRQFGQLKTRYRGLAKNRAQIVTLFALLEFLKESH